MTSVKHCPECGTGIVVNDHTILAICSLCKKLVEPQTTK